LEAAVNFYQNLFKQVGLVEEPVSDKPKQNK
jgi:hypothetical protein